MDIDAAEKRNNQDIVKNLQKRTTDFEENNILSYVYTSKVHQSYKLGEKNDYL